MNKRVYKILFYIYMTILIFLVLFKFDGSLTNLAQKIHSVQQNRSMGYWNCNLMPGATISLYLRHIPSGFAVKNLVGNVVAFIPLGYFLPTVYPKYRKWWKTILFSFLFLLAAESIQLVSMLGVFDVDDIILNLAGCLLGYFVCIFTKFLVGTKD